MKQKLRTRSIALADALIATLERDPRFNDAFERFSARTILARHGAYVRRIASTVRRQFHGKLDLDELVAWGQVGLLEAADRYDPEMGATFLTFAHYRIKGAIFDGLQKMGVITRSEARRGQAAPGGEAGTRRVAYAGGANEAGAVAGLAIVYATSLEGTDGLQIADDAPGADERLEIEQLRTRVTAALARLPEKERGMLEDYYFRGKTLEEAGRAWGLSKSWSSRLLARALDRLKELIDDGRTDGSRGRSRGRRSRR